MKKIVVIDVGDIMYSRYFDSSIQQLANAAVITKYSSVNNTALKYFYRYSESMRSGIKRNLVRGFEYILGYNKCLSYIKHSQPDVVHIQWALIPPADYFFWRKIKKYTKKLIFTAHDVLPHDMSAGRIKWNRILYNIPDTIVVHGEYCKDELRKFYPDVKTKVYIQKHGVFEKKDTYVNEDMREKHLPLLEAVEEGKTIISFIGQICDYKGLDLLADAWKRIDCENLFLLVAGRTMNDFSYQMEKIKQELSGFRNCYIYNDRFSDEEENLFYGSSDVIILPYKTASMSGVIFSAAQYEKTVLSTKAGCLGEYLNDVKDCTYTCEPTSESIFRSLVLISKESKSQLIDMGRLFSEYIYRCYSWEKIIKSLISEAY